MTYKEIINRFRTITDNHLMLQDFGYGDLSDLKYVSQLGTDEERVGYPYLYLLPSSSTRNGVVMNYSFNMIVMDMARPEDGANTDEFDNYITIQSQCQQYIDDVLAQLYYFYKDQPEIQLTGITHTPFKEKYQDVVAGMTATITIAVPTPLNECIAPYENWVLKDTITIGNQTASYNNLFPIGSYDIAEGDPRKYKVELDIDFKVLYDISSDPTPYDTPSFTVLQDSNDEPPPRFIQEIQFSGTDRGVQQMRETFEVIVGDIPGGNNNRLFFYWGYPYNDRLPGYLPPTSPIVQGSSIQQIRGTIKIYLAE